MNTTQSTDGLVLRFTSKSGKTPATLHAPTCGVAYAETRHVSIIRENVSAHVADLVERGFKVKRCACCKVG